MDHIVYLDKKAKELEKLISGEKTMIVRGAAGRKLPYGRVESGEKLFFTVNNGSGKIYGEGITGSIINSDKLTKEESAELINKNMNKLDLTPAQIKRWSGKRYLILIEIKDFQEIDSFNFDKAEFSNMDDWLIVEDIEKARI